MIIPPKTADIVNQIRANVEATVAQTTPNAPKAFNRVLAATLGMVSTGLYKLGLERTKANLALTATGTDLDKLGSEKGVVREPAVATVLTIRIGATVGSAAQVPIGTLFVSDSTGAYYYATTTGTEADGTVELEVTAEDYGDATILESADTLTIGAPIIDIETIADVYTCDTSGQDEETDTDYRRRVLAAWRTVGGGGNAADYRRWAEAVPGIARAYPYSGRPVIWTVTADDISFDDTDNSINSVDTDFTAEGPLGTLVTGDVVVVSGAGAGVNAGEWVVQSVATAKIVVQGSITTAAAGSDVTLANLSMPGDRTVFVESSTEDDGIPTVEQIAAVRSLINIGEDGIGRPPLGCPDSTLFVEPIERTTVDVAIYDLEVDGSTEASLKAQMSESLASHFATYEPYVVALDYEGDRVDTVSEFTVGIIIQDVFSAFGATASAVVLSIDSVAFTSRTLGQGERLKLGTVDWEITP